MPKKHDNEWSAWKDSLGLRQAEEESTCEKWQPKTYSVKEWIKYPLQVVRNVGNLAKYSTSSYFDRGSNAILSDWPDRSKR